MYFVLTTKHNVSPSTSVDLLERAAQVMKDYCGVLTEEAIRKNFVLIYELVDEILDFGYPQATEELMNFIYSSPVLTDTETRSAMLTWIPQKTTSSKTANQSIAQSSHKDEIFVDLFERLNVLFGSGGQILHSEVEGSIVIKSFIKGPPKIRLGLNEDMIVGRNKDSNSFGRTVIDQCSFHDCVMFHEWESERTICFYPPEGEFSVFKYRTQDSFQPPFKLFPFMEEPGANQLDVLVKVVADFADTTNANKVFLRVPLPVATVSCSAELDSSATGTSYEFDQKHKEFVWSMGRIKGGSEMAIRIKLNLDDHAGNYKREVGPISMEFEIPMFICSSVQIKFMRASENEKTAQPVSLGPFHYTHGLVPV